MTPQLFNFQNQNVRVLRDEQGNPWFVAKDVCSILGYKRKASNVVERFCRPKGVTKLATPSEGGNQKVTVINEGNLYRLVAKSEMPYAEKFEEWIFDEVLPSIRKTGSYSLRSLILPEPTSWERTFPHEFMRQALRLYGLPYDPSKGTPQFMGNFINKYVYSALDKEATKELKTARLQWGGNDDFVFLHQFLNTDGRNALKDHLIAITTLMKGSPDINHFDSQFFKVFLAPNQLELYLRSR